MRNILLLGTHGTGKTTLGKYLIDMLGDWKTHLIDGMSRSAASQGFTVNKLGTSVSQAVILEAFVQDVINVSSEIDTMIHVHSLERSYAYSLLANKNGHENCPTTEFCDTLHQWCLYNVVNVMDYVFYVPIEFPLKKDAIRETEDIDYQKAIDLVLRDLLNDAKRFYYTVTGTPAQRAKFSLRTRGEPHEQINTTGKATEFFMDIPNPLDIDEEMVKNGVPVYKYKPGKGT